MQITRARETCLDLVEQAADEGGCLGAVDLAGDVDGIAILGLGHNHVRKLRGERPVRAFLLCPGVVSGRQVHDTQHLRGDAFVDAQLVPEALCRTCAVAELENGSSRKVNPKNVDVGRPRRSAKTTARTGAITPDHVADHNVLRLSAGVTIAAIARFAAGGGTNEVPAEFACLRAIALFAACLAAETVPSVSRECYPVELAPHLMPTGELVKPIVAAFGVTPQEHCTYCPCMLNALVLDAMGAFGAMPENDTHALCMCAAAVMTEQCDMQSVFDAINDGEAPFCARPSAILLGPFR